MSQEELAHALGVHESYVGKLERAEKVCSVDVLAKVTGALDVSVTNFYLQPEGSQEQETTSGKIVDKLRYRSV
nr:helix-turn-helix transcriptional regulator [Paenibacillus typhae]